jgi:hypothetical protein
MAAVAATTTQALGPHPDTKVTAPLLPSAMIKVVNEDKYGP